MELLTNYFIKKITLLFASKPKGINKIIFTVAGSTQELHEKYRVGTTILRNTLWASSNQNLIIKYLSVMKLVRVFII